MARSFKSVGTLVSNKKFDVIKRKDPIGFKTPLRLGSTKEGIFAMHFDAATQIQDNFRNLVMTNHGERLGLSDFGANLGPLVFEATVFSENLEEEAMTRIKTAVQKYLPFIDLQSFESEFGQNDDGMNQLKVRIIYGVPAVGADLKGLEVVIIGGG